MTTVNFYAQMMFTIIRAFWLSICLVGMVLMWIGVVAAEPEQTFLPTSLTFKQGFGLGLLLVSLSFLLALTNRFLIQPFTLQNKK